MSGRSEDVLDLSSFRQRVEERRTNRVGQGRARSVACRRLSCIAGLLSRPVRRPRALTQRRGLLATIANACAASIAFRGRRSSGRSRSKIANVGRTPPRSRRPPRVRTG